MGNEINSINEFVSDARKDFSIIEENTNLVISELIDSQKKNLGFVEEFSEEKVFLRIKELRNSFEKKDSFFLGKLFGVPISVSDAILVEGFSAKAGMSILKEYNPVFSASIISKLEKEGAIILAKTTHNKEEMLCGASGFNSFTKGVHAGICVNTNNSLTLFLSEVGGVGLVPSYGAVSRNGLISLADSIDKIGVVSKNTSDAEIVFEVIKGSDEFDSITNSSFFEQKKEIIPRIGVVTNFVKIISEENQKLFWEKITELKNLFEVKKIELLLNEEYSTKTNLVINNVEASTNLARFSGLRYGVQKEVIGKNFEEYFSSIRTSEFSGEEKFKIISGTFFRTNEFREDYYIKSAKIRRILVEEYLNKFNEVDLLIFPLTKKEGVGFKEKYLFSPNIVSANLAGLPQLIIGFDSIKEASFSLIIVAPHFSEQNLFSVGKKLGDKK